jgi:hypothetical protein
MALPALLDFNAGSAIVYISGFPEFIILSLSNSLHFEKSLKPLAGVDQPMDDCSCEFTG